jgi:hypothetical protein
MSSTTTRKKVPWAGWLSEKPSRADRKIMKKTCKRQQKVDCFLGPHKSFPICKKNTCEISNKGLWAAYIRAKEWGSPRKSKKSRKHHQGTYQRIAQKAKFMLESRGYPVK